MQDIFTSSQLAVQGDRRRVFGASVGLYEYDMGPALGSDFLQP